jgi:hypothetical protein
MTLWMKRETLSEDFRTLCLKKGLLRTGAKILSEETSISSTVIYLKRQSYME